MTTAERLTALEKQVAALNTATVGLLAELTANNQMLSEAIAAMQARKAIVVE